MELFTGKGDDVLRVADQLLVLTLAKSHYERLGVARSADVETIHLAFRRRSKVLHPDTAPLPAEQAAKQFQLLCEAYELLTDPVRRQAYDASLMAEGLLAASSSVGTDALPSRSSSATKGVGVRRPLSGGERPPQSGRVWFSLLLLGLTLMFSLLIGFGVAWAHGRELQVLPSWLNSEQTTGRISITGAINVVVASRTDAFGSAFPRFS